jgi:predicted lipoprotein with Yx(FWY)xxD motif
MRIKRVVPTALVAVVVGAGGISGAAIASASGHGASAASAATVQLKSTKLGKILVNSKGLTLYMWKKDKRGAKTSACNKSCQALWPLVTVSGKPTAGHGVSKSKLGTIKVEGKKEVTYNGWPLYTYAPDTKAGETKGQGSLSPPPAWYVLSSSGNPITKK